MTNATSPIPCFTWQALLDAVTRYFAAPGDPFVTDTLVVPSAGHARYIAQHLARQTLGICAGIQMTTPSQFAVQLCGRNSDDPWRGTPFVTAIADALAEDGELGRAAGATDAVFDAANSLSRVFSGCWQRCPSMLFNWEDGNDVGPGGDPLPNDKVWQPVLWRRLVASLAPEPHPAQAVLDGAALVADHPGRHGVVLITPPDPIEQPVIDALGVVGAPIWAYRPVVDATQSRYDPGWPVKVSIGPSPRRGGSATLLHQVQDDLAAGRAPSGRRMADGSIQIHASHGPNRQVEVLRDVLCAAFDDLPGLEPRDVLVLATDLKVYGPLMEAAFAPESGHPAANLRVQVASRRENLLLAGLADCLRLATSRATVDDLAAWCRNSLVRRQFGLDDDDRLADLMAGAAITWGIDRAQRVAAGLDVGSGTWLDGVQRLVLALATTTPIGAVIPAAGVQSQDADLAGALAELVSRLRRALIGAATPAPLGEWAKRLINTADDLFAVVHDDAWMLEDVNALLARWGRDASSVLLTGVQIADLLDRHRVTNGRPTFGNGALQVRPLGELQGVGFRVVCLLGLDDASFPAPMMTRADDLLFDLPAGPGVGDDDRRHSRTAFRDALLAATDKFIIVTRGADERTGAALPAPVVVLDLLADCAVPGRAGAWNDGGDAGLVRRYALQPYAWSSFASDADRPPVSYDSQSLRAARRLAEGPGAPTPPGWLSFDGATDILPSAGTDAATLDEVEAFLANPARFLLKRACNLTLTSPDDAPDDALPAALGSLADWSIGQTMLDDLLAGTPVGQARAQALAGRDVPPGRLGVLAVDQILRKVGDLPRDVAALGIPDTAVVGIGGSGVHFDGAVTVRGNTVLVTRYGRLRAAQVLTAWVRLLALTAQGVDGLVGQAWATNWRVTLTPPPPETARGIIKELVTLTATATRQLIPLPPDTGAALVGVTGLTRGSNAEERAVEAFAGRFGEGKQPAWRALVGEPSLAALRSAGAFDELSKWLWAPIVQAIDTRGGRNA